MDTEKSFCVFIGTVDTEQVPLGSGTMDTNKVPFGSWILSTNLMGTLDTEKSFWVLIGTMDTRKVPFGSWILSNWVGLEFFGKPVQNHYGMNSLYTFGKLFHWLAFFWFL